MRNSVFRANRILMLVAQFHILDTSKLNKRSDVFLVGQIKSFGGERDILHGDSVRIVECDSTLWSMDLAFCRDAVG